MERFRTSPTFPAAVLWLVLTLALAVGMSGLAPHAAIPMHVGFDGSIDRYGGKHEGIGFLAVLLAVGVFAWTGLEVLRRRLRRHHAYVAAQVVLLTVFYAIDLLMAAHVFGHAVGLDATTPRFHMAAMAMLFAAIGAFLGKVPQNPLVGVRTPWSLSSRLAWEKSNRMAGRLLFWIGTAGLLVAPLAPEPQGFRTLIAGVLLAAAAAVFESWRVWRSDSDRKNLSAR